MRLFVWDEIANLVTEVKPQELFVMNAESGWLTVGWTKDLRVEVRQTDRHTSLECWAKNEEEARFLFMQVPVYREAQRGSL